jgi:radial spoke head protein 9
MDIYRVCEDLKFVNQIGKTLNLQERMKLELALMKLTEATNFD